MGGAQRGNRRRKQQQSAARAARAVSAARGSRDLTKIIVGGVVVAVIAAAVIAGVLVSQHKAAQAAQTVIPARTVSGSARYPATIDTTTATVLVGKPAAKVTVDAYEDFLCPICRDFESAYFTTIDQQLQAGTIKVRYHMINLLDTHSVPAGYSMMAANTALAVATVAPDKFVDFHYSLYQKQPAENGPGWTQAQLTSLADRLGVHGAQFDHLVTTRAYDKQIQANLDTAARNPTLVQTMNGSTGFGTPTVLVGNAIVDWQNDTTWLTDAVKANYPTS